MPETARLAVTIETWRPHILVALRHGVNNARTRACSGSSTVKQASCGYRNMDNYERRILTHIALNRAA